MDLKRFVKEMQQCEFLIRKDSKREVYWRGYQRGLKRAYHGDKFGTPAEHQKMLQAVNSTDEKEKETGKGYRNALQDWEKGEPPKANTHRTVIIWAAILTPVVAGIYTAAYFVSSIAGLLASVPK